MNDEKVIEFPVENIYRIPVNSPHDCDDPTSPPPFRDENCKCNRKPRPGDKDEANHMACYSVKGRPIHPKTGPLTLAST